jgi:hypothetical protein
MRIGFTPFGGPKQHTPFGGSREPLVVVEDRHGVQRTMTLSNAGKLRNGGGGDEPEGPIDKIIRLVQEFFSNLSF